MNSVKLPKIPSSGAQDEVETGAAQDQYNSGSSIQRLELKVHDMTSGRTDNLTGHSYTSKYASGNSWQRPARNILELEQKFQTVYVQSNNLA